jgi:release factor glutamine methyltransferase
MLELGCGTGIVALHAAKLGASVTAADISPIAIECTRRNAARNDLKVKVVRSDLFEDIRGSFDVVAFNPPYLPREGGSTSWIERSWDGGDQGSEVSVRFLEQAWKHLAPGGRAYLVLSSIGGLMSVLRAARERYEAELIAEERMFFESVYVYRLKARHFGI